MLLQLEMKGATAGWRRLPLPEVVQKQWWWAGGDLLWVRGSVCEGLHGELAERAEHQEGVFLQDVGEAGGAVGALQGLGILSNRKCMVSGQRQARKC